MTRWLTALLLLVSVAAAGEDEAARIEALERRNKELEERLARLEARDQGDETVLSDAVDDYVEEGLGLNLVIRRGSVQGMFQIFGDVGLRYDNPALAGRGNSFFFDGSVDLFFTARAGDHFHVLSETVFLNSLGEPKDSGGFDQERLWGAWRFSDLLQIKLGLEHGPISRWNNQFHHGRWLEMTINRPFLARFESDGGILPMHNAGVEFTGAVHSGAGRIEYFLIVTNGRGRIPTDTQEFSDRNNSKAVEVGFGFRPITVDGLWIGIFGRFDQIGPNPSDPARQHSIGQTIGSLQIDYRGDPLEVLFEFAYVDDRDRQSDMSFGHILTYVQVAYRVNDRWVVYSRFDVREMDRGDPYYVPYDRDLDIWEVLLGVRFDFIANASLKLEAGGGKAEERDTGGGVATDGYFRFGLQLAWVF